jgi:hypothetical protein
MARENTLCSLAVGLFDNMGRYGLFGGLKKSFGKKTIGGRTFEFDELKQWRLVDLQWLFNTAIQEGDPDAAGWAFELMIPHYGGDATQAWNWAMYAMQNTPEYAAYPVVERMAHYVNDDQLMAMQHGPWGAYLLGKLYLEKARAEPQYGKSGRERGPFKKKRKAALHFLGMARSKADMARQQPAADPYRAAAMAAGLAAIAASAYEAASYFGEGKARKFVGATATGVE